MQLDKIVSSNGRLYRQDAAGNLYVWQSTGLNGLGDLDGWWKRITRAVTKPFKQIEKQIRRDPIFKEIRRFEKRVDKEITRSKYARGILYGAGAVFAPFTGGLSLAAASAIVQKSKASATGKSFGAQLAQGLGAGVIGWVAGVGIVYGAGAAGIGSASIPGAAPGLLTPFGTAGVAPGVYAGGSVASPGIVGAASPASAGFYSGYTGAVAAAAPSAIAAPVSFLPSVGNVLGYAGTALKTVGSVLPILIQTGLLGSKDGRIEQAPSGEYYDRGAPAPAPFEGSYGGGGGGGGPNMPPEGAPGDEAAAKPGRLSPATLGIGAAVAGLLLFTTMKGKHR